MNSAYARIISKLIAHQWAMEPRAFENMLSLINGMSSIDPELFHQVPPEDFQSITESLGNPVEGTRYAYKKDNIGIVTIYGPIIPHSDWFAEASGMVSIEKLSSSFRALESDISVEQTVLLMDTPGGDVTGISEFHDQIAASRKKITAHTVGMAASAGYWIASAANKITSVDTGMLGSIGVITTVTDFSEALEKRGIKQFDIVSSQSPRKRTDLTTAEGRTELQAILDDLAAVFIGAVAKGRDVSVETVIDTFGRGAVLSASRALDAGMIDRITTTAELFDGFTENKLSLFMATEKQASNGATSQHMESNMTDKKDAVKTAQEATAPDVDQITKDAAENERARIQGIEGILADYDEHPPAVKSAIAKVIDGAKFDAKEDKDSVLAKVKDAVIDAQKSMIADTAKARTALAKKLEAVPDVPNGEQKDETDPDAVDENRVKNIAKGYKNANGGK